MQGHRVLAGAVALLIALAGVAAVILAFSGEPVPPVPTTTVGNGLLAFSGSGEIYVVAPDGGEPRQVTDFRGGEYGLDVHWSPDGTKFAFRVWTNGDYELFVMNADGTGLSNVTGSVAVSEFSWSPDGTMLAFTSVQQGTDLDVFVVRPDGTGLRAVVESRFTEHRPQWSPDGTRIAFERWPVRDRDPGTADIYVVGLETGEIIPLVTSPGDDTAIAWSPAGDTLAFTSDRDGDRDLFLVGADGSGERQLTDLTNEGATTAHGWSPDGTRLSFVVGDGEQWDLWIVNADGSGLTRLTPSNRDDGPAIWSPDGTLLAFTASDVLEGDNSGTFDVYTIRPDGTGEQRITSGRVALGWDLSWQPLADGAQPAPEVLVPKANGSIHFRVGGGEGGTSIEAVEADGSGRRVVFEGEVMRFARIAWSPDGTKIAYQNPIVGERGIYVADPDGSDPVRLTDGVNDSWASWSPDGTRILFSSTLYDPSIEMCMPGDPHEFRCPTDIYVMDADGSDIVRLTDDPADEFQPVWSPDGSRIAFARSLSDQISHPAIFTMNPDGTDVRQVSEGTEGSDFSPSWAPDGSRLIFTGIHNENLGIWMVNGDGSGEHMVLGGVGAWFVIDAEWSPDGNLIAFVGNSTTGDYSPDDALYVMRPDGSELEQIADAPGVGIAGDIAWQPLLSPAEGSELPTPRSAEIIETFEVGVDVRSVAYGEGSVWVAASNNDGTFAGKFVRIDPETHDVEADIPVDVIPTWEVGGGAMVVEDGSLWVTGSMEAPGAFDDPGGGADAAVIRIDTSTNEVTQTFTLGGAHGADLTFLDGELWVLVFGDETVDHSMEVVRVDPATGDVLARIPLKTKWAHTIAAAGGHLVVYEGGQDGVNVGGHVTSIDPATASVAARVEVPSEYFEGGPVVWRDHVWVAAENGFARFDPVSGDLAAGSSELDPTRYAFCCGFIEADDRGIWFIGFDGATGQGARRLDVFDPSTGTVIELVELTEGNPVAMAIAPDSVWVLNYEGTLTHIALT